MKTRLIPTTGATAALIIGAVATPQPCLWEHIPAEPAGDWSNRFHGVVGTGPADVWAVGTATWSGAPSLETAALIEHFDGSAWRIVPAPAVGTRSDLAAVVAIAPDEAYAVGSYVPSRAGTSSVPLFLVWDGASWRQESEPEVVGNRGLLHAAAVIDGELWAGGERWFQEPPPVAGGLPLVARWDGATWRQDSPPPMALVGQDSFNEIAAIDATSADDVWAVGTAHQQERFTGDPEAFFTRYITHYDGAAWRIIDEAPNPNPSFTVVLDVAAIAPDDVWIAGYYNEASTNQPYLAHFDGASWSLADLPMFPGQGAILRGVTARGPGEVYGAGLTADAGGRPGPLILRFDGESWTSMPIEATDGQSEQYHAVTTLPGAEVWAVGQYFTPEKAPLTHRLSCEGAPCYADCDASGSLDLFDFLCFQNEFAAGAPEADCDASGGLDFFDFLCFQNAFAAGCP